MLISKGALNTLVQVTSVDVPTRVLTFADNDSLRLNQSGAERGNLIALNAADPVDAPAATRISRLRMITYYLDNITDSAHPRLVSPGQQRPSTTFDNTLGTAVAIDALDLQFAFDISNGTGNPGDVEMTGVTWSVAARATPTPARERRFARSTSCSVAVAGRAGDHLPSNTLESQVSLRAMAFVDRYR